MHPLLAEAERELGISLPNLASAAQRTYERRQAAADAIAAFLSQHDLQRQDQGREPLIVAFGSMPRQEMSRRSDFDYLVVLTHLETDPERIRLYRRAAEAALEAIGVDPPGSSGLFGIAVSGTELVNTIGLDTDTNLHHSRRILLLEESIPLNAANQWDELVTGVVARYLHEQDEPGSWVPRFLLNDVVRFWRTVAVDYQAKRWQELTGKKWGLRYVKLITTRKLTFAATVASLFAPVIMNVPTTTDFLRTQFSLPPLARLAQLAPHLSEPDQAALSLTLQDADRIIGWLDDPDFREAVETVDKPREAPAGSHMRAAKDLSDALQDHLEALFFSAEPLASNPAITLGALTRRYLSF